MLLPRCCPGILAMLALALSLLPTAPATAAVDVYTIERVAVDVTAESAAAARERALARGHETAFRRLMQRLVPAGRDGGVPSPGYETIANLVRDFEVFDERTSSVRYLAELTFRFQPRAVRRFLRGRGVAFAETRSKPVVVLPLYGAAGDAVLWQGENPWREAWAEADLQSGLVPLVVPLGDLADIRAISPGAAIDLDRVALNRIASRHGAGDVLVTQAISAGDPEAGRASVQVVTSRIGTALQERTFVDNIRQREGESRQDMLGRAVAEVVREVEAAWKRANLLDFEEQKEMTVEVPVTGLDQWVGVRRRLESTPAIGSARLRLLTSSVAEVRLTYFGDVEQLRLALAQHDLALEEGGASGWMLTAAGAARDAGESRSGEADSAEPVDEPREDDAADGGDAANGGNEARETRQ